MKSSLFKYQIGLLVLGILTLGLVVFVAMEAGKAKADLTTKKAADKIADQLNVYVAQEGVPESLGAAGIKDVPDAVRYTKQSDTKYRFCVTYKAQSTGFNPDTVVQEAALGVATRGLGSSYTGDSSSYLYLQSTHKKGENCQDVTVPARSDSFFDFPSSDDGSSPSFDFNSLNGSGGDYFSQPNTSDSYEFPVQ